MVKNGKECFIILIHTFFISFIINLFIVLYSIYSLVNIIVFHNLQGLKFIKKFLLPFVFSTILFFIVIIIFYPIFTAKSLIFPYSLSKFDIALEYPTVWNYIKNLYCITCFIAIYLSVFSLQSFIFVKKQKKQKKPHLLNLSNYNTNFDLLIGSNNKNEKVYIPEKGLYQNILVTGTIGSR